MTERYRRNILNALHSAMEVAARIKRDQEALDSMEANLKYLVRNGATTEDPVLDLVLHYGLPSKTENLEKNLREIDRQLRTCAGEFILTELISPDRSSKDAPQIHQVTVGVLATEAPIMHYIEEEKFSGVVIPTQSKKRILLATEFLHELETSDKPHWALLNSTLRYSFEIAIGHAAVWRFLSPERYSVAEVSSTRQARMKRIARQLNDLSMTYPVSLEIHHELQTFIRDSVND